MRTILHSDLNNFYASVECLKNPALWSVPMAVCGDPQARHGIILSKNELAKAAGVKTAEAIWQAKEKWARIFPPICATRKRCGASTPIFPIAWSLLGWTRPGWT